MEFDDVIMSQWMERKMNHEEQHLSGGCTWAAPGPLWEVSGTASSVLLQAKPHPPPPLRSGQQEASVLGPWETFPPGDLPASHSQLLVLQAAPGGCLCPK